MKACRGAFGRRLGLSAKAVEERQSRFIAGLVGAIGSVMILAPVQPASAGPAACSQFGGTAVCTGNQSLGIASGSDFSASDTILNVHSLTGGINPGPGTAGILFSGTTTAEINSFVPNGIHISGTADGVLGVAPGDVVINHSGNIYNAFRGINGRSTGGDVTINSSGKIDNATAAAINGYADAGSVTINQNGPITNAQDRGISAIALDGDVNITQQGKITSVNQAIFAQATGGSIDISSSGKIYTSSGDAIDAEATSPGATVSVYRNGNTNAEDRAIFVRSSGDGSVTSYGNVTSRDIDAIHIESLNGAATIFSRGDVVAANQALFAHGSTGASIDSKGDVTAGYGANLGNDAVFALTNTGSATVKSVGDISALNGRGVVAITFGGPASVYSKGTVTSKTDAVYAQGTTGASVAQYGDVSSSQANGISAYTDSGDASVTGKGTVTAYVNGIIAHTNSGDASIDHQGSVTASQGLGIQAYTGSGNATVTQNGNVWAKTIGIDAVSQSGGATVTANANVYSEGSSGIEADSLGGSGDATIHSNGDIDAYTHGLLAVDTGTGNSSITQVGDVTSRQGTGAEAFATTGNASVSITGDTNAYLFGMKAITNGAGSVATVINNGDVYAATDTGIYAQARAAGGTASVTSKGNVFADEQSGFGGYGIQVLADGNASGTSNGNITSVTNNAFDVESLNGTASLTSKGTISAGNQGLFALGGTGASISSIGNVNSSNDAIFAYAQTSGNATVTSRGDVSSTVGRGVIAMTWGSGDATVVSNGTVNAHVDGVTAFVGGNGNASVTQTGNVTSAAASGIVANVNGTGNATIDANGDVQAQQQGVSAITGTGDASVTYSGNVNSSQAFGIRADVKANGDATIDASGTVTAQLDGVTANVEGNGDALVQYSGDVTSNVSTGLAALAQGTGGATIDASGSVNSALESLLAVAGTGSAKITYDGTLTSTGAYGANATTTDGSVVENISGDITSQLFGIQGIAGGANRSVDITWSGGTIDALTSRGISGEALGSGSTVTISSTGDINSYAESIFAQANGDASITSVGDLTSTAGHAAYALSQAGSAYISSTGTVMASDVALLAMGPGGATIHSMGNVTSAYGRGIDAETSGGAAEVVSNGDISARGVGIYAKGQTGASVQSSGNVTINSYGRGIDAETVSGAASITSVGDITSQDSALFAIGNSGTTINSTGDVTATGSDAVYAYNQGTGKAKVVSVGTVKASGRGVTALSISGDVSVRSTGNVTASNMGLQAYTWSGNASVTSKGDITSTGHVGIQAMANSGGSASIDSTGTVKSALQGVIAIASGTATVVQTGDVTSSNSVGIEADSWSGSASITSNGTVQSRLEGILAIGGGGSASVTQVGDVIGSAYGTFGISSLAYGSNSSATVDVTGNVSAYQTAIQAIAFGSDGSASITSKGDVSSTEAFGILAQATNGGTATIDSTGDVNAREVGVFGLADGAVNITYNGNSTSSENDAIFGQSYSGTVAINSHGDESGARNGIFALGYGNVDVTHVGSATTSSNERALYAESQNGNVMVDVTGHIYVDGIGGDSDAIFAYAPNGHADVTVRAGSQITGGTDPLASFGVEFGSAAGTNTLTNYGIIDDANGGKTIGGDTAADVVENYGLVNGDFYLGGGANVYDNMAGGWTYFKSYSSVGVGNDFNNTGFVSPYGPTVIGSSVLDGNFNQTGTGTYWADLDYGTGAADYLDVTGNIGAGGQVHAYITNFGTSAGPVAATVMHSGGSVTDNGIVGADQGPLLVDVTTTAQTVDLNVAVDFGAGGKLAPYSQPVGNFIQNLFASSIGGGLTPDEEAFYLGLVNYGTTRAYSDLLGAPAAVGASVPEVYAGAGAFADNLFSCHQGEGAYKYISEGTCYWALGGVRHYSQSGGGMIGFDETAASFSSGAQFRIDPNWVVGFAGGYEHGSGSAGSSVDLKRDMFSAGVVAKGNYGDTQIAAALSGGIGTIDSSRMVTFPVTATATGDRTVSYVDLTGRLSHVATMGEYYLKPSLEAAATWVRAGAFDETGAGIADYSYGSIDQVFGRGTAALEIGRDFHPSGTVVFRPYVSAGITGVTGGDVTVTASMPDLGPGTFSTTSSTDSLFADLRAGVYAFGGSGWTTRLEYRGRFSGHSSDNTATLKLDIPF